MSKVFKIASLFSLAWVRAELSRSTFRSRSCVVIWKLFASGAGPRTLDLVLSFIRYHHHDSTDVLASQRTLLAAWTAGFESHQRSHYSYCLDLCAGAPPPLALKLVFYSPWQTLWMMLVFVCFYCLVVRQEDSEFPRGCPLHCSPTNQPRALLRASQASAQRVESD